MEMTTMAKAWRMVIICELMMSYSLDNGIEMW